MSANPISWLEIDAFSRGMDIDIDPWERSVIRRLDVAVLAVSDKKSKSGPTKQAKMEVEAKDGQGVASLLRGFGKKKG